MSSAKNQISVCFISFLLNDITQSKIMPKRRKRGAGLGYRRKHNLSGRSFIRRRINGAVTTYKNDSFISESNKNEIIGNSVNFDSRVTVPNPNHFT